MRHLDADWRGQGRGWWKDMLSPLIHEPLPGKKIWKNHNDLITAIKVMFFHSTCGNDLDKGHVADGGRLQIFLPSRGGSMSPLLESGHALWLLWPIQYRRCGLCQFLSPELRELAASTSWPLKHLLLKPWATTTEEVWLLCWSPRVERPGHLSEAILDTPIQFCCIWIPPTDANQCTRDQRTSQPSLYDNGSDKIGFYFWII